MIELGMVRRMALSALVLAPFVIGALWIWNGSTYAFSGAVGLAMTIANLWLSARIIGGVAENNPQLLLPAAMLSFLLGLGILVGIAVGLRSIDAIYFPVTGFVLIGTHLIVVLWEAARAYPVGSRRSDALNARS